MDGAGREGEWTRRNEHGRKGRGLGVGEKEIRFVNNERGGEGGDTACG